MEFALLTTKILIMLIGLIGGGWQMVLSYRQKQMGQLAIAQADQPAVVIDRLLMLVYPIAMLIWLVSPERLAWADFHTPPLIAWLGIVIIICGGIGWLWSQKSMGSFWSGLAIVQPGHQVIMVGPYRLVRHPMYASFWTLGLGGLLATHNLAVSLLFLAHVFVVSLSAKGEEGILRKNVPGYMEYELRVRWRLIPGIY